MGRVAKLIMVSVANNNKFYDMVEEGNTINVRYGRVGSTECTASYHTSRWDTLYKSKVKKGYKDVTGLRVEPTVVDFTAISSDVISAFVAELQAFAKGSISSNYTVSSDAVTQKQVDEAQKLLDQLAEFAGRPRRPNGDAIDKVLLELYSTIPRRMQQVKDHLMGSGRKLEDIVTEEQSTLDVMKGQVRINTVQKNNKVDSKQTILDAMGLVIEPTNDDDVRLIKQELGDIARRYRRSFRVTNKRTQERFDKWLKTASNKTRKLFWHGSRNENWWSILDSGLVLRPTNAVITGKMFGTGLYGADKAGKSLGYTSLHGSRWARGNDSKAFMALFRFHVGNQYVASRYESWMGQLTYEKLQKLGDYDSFFAKGGADLINNEYIVYMEDQIDIQFIVELQ
jgi:poly [ADP-ribose] polymerase 2/3/4